MVRLSTAGAVPEVIEGVAAPVVTFTVAVAFAAKGAALGDPHALRASRPLAANKTAMRYLMMPPDRNDATRRLVGVNRAIGHPISRQERPGSLDGAPLRFRGLVAGGPAVSD